MKNPIILSIDIYKYIYIILHITNILLLSIYIYLYISYSYTSVFVNYTTADVTARVADNDYVPASGTLEIPVPQMSGTVTVKVNGDDIYEQGQTFRVDLSNPVNSVLGATSSGM